MTDKQTAPIRKSRRGVIVTFWILIIGIVVFCVWSSQIPPKPTPAQQSIAQNSTATPSVSPTTPETASAKEYTQTAIASVTAAAQDTIDAMTQRAFDKTSTKTFISRYKPIVRGELVSYADKHTGENVVVQGRVFNIIDDMDLQIFLAGSNDAVYIQAADPFSNVYKNDFVTVYGTVEGTQDMKNAFGQTIQQPLLTAAEVVK